MQQPELPAFDGFTTEIVRTTPEEMTVSEIVDVVETGGRVVLDVTVFGEPTQATMRKALGQYYCDTGTRLFVHDSESAFRTCLSEHGLARRQAANADGDQATAD